MILGDLIMSKRIPSFSIVFETENLSSVELDNLYRSLDSLSCQSVPIHKTNEFLIIDSGNVSIDTRKKICERYPFVKFHKVHNKLDYHEAKMLGANLSSGGIVVFCDSDCVYEKRWLENILLFFTEHPQAHIVAGETSAPLASSAIEISTKGLRANSVSRALRMRSRLSRERF